MLAVGIIGIVLMLLLPRFLQSIAETINQQPTKSIGWGFGGFIAFLLLIILTGGSLIGSILIPIAALIIGLVKLIGINAISLFLGEKILRNRRYSIP
ncbi:hypothetical protein [Rivularia sp. UHCC 0363]|uniref:hypothetical protein n=1 Tax=Rivularia sp. UHCC 0363 TaxID=3110244 RepID=UPI002B1EF5DC|nr:hypothetical protein [Rivularia sp. UHCC 0363]MEA5593538.1 hypothetical protein [Rivularia sp. UHCC 0363]